MNFSDAVTKILESKLSERVSPAMRDFENLKSSLQSFPDWNAVEKAFSQFVTTHGEDEVLNVAADYSAFSIDELKNHLKSNYN